MVNEDPWKLGFIRRTRNSAGYSRSWIFLSLYKHVCMYHYQFIMGIKCRYCKGSKSLRFSDSLAYANEEELGKHVVA